MLASGPLVVFITSWGIIIIILSFLIYFGLYLQLLHLNRFLSPWRIQSLGLVVGAGVVSLCAAEAGNAYVVGPTIYLPQVDHLLNLPVLIFNLAALLYLMWRQANITTKQRTSRSVVLQTPYGELQTQRQPPG
jgi:hypothetical protein